MIPESEILHSKSTIYSDSALYEQIAAIIAEIGEKELLASGVISRSTLWRWKTNVNQTAPNPSLILAILKIHSGLKSMPQIASKYGNIIKYFLEKSFPVSFEEAQKREVEENAKLINDEYDFHIYFICCNDRGATVDEIVYTLGTIALRNAKISKELINDELILSMGSIARPKIERLISLDILKFDGKYLKCSKTDPYINEEDGLKQSLNMLQNIVNSDGWSSGRSVFYLSSNAIEEDIAKKACLMLKTTFLEVLELLESNKSDSETARPFAFCVAGEGLITTPEQSQKELH